MDWRFWSLQVAVFFLLDFLFTGIDGNFSLTSLSYPLVKFGLNEYLPILSLGAHLFWVICCSVGSVLCTMSR